VRHPPRKDATTQRSSQPRNAGARIRPLPRLRAWRSRAVSVTRTRNANRGIPAPSSSLAWLHGRRSSAKMGQRTAGPVAAREMPNQRADTDKQQWCTDPSTQRCMVAVPPRAQRGQHHRGTLSSLDPASCVLWPFVPITCVLVCGGRGERFRTRRGAEQRCPARVVSPPRSPPDALQGQPGHAACSGAGWG